MVEIREAQLKDFESIYHLNCEEMGYKYSQEDTKKNLSKLLERKCDKILVVTKDDEVIGYIHANDYELIYAPPMKNIMGIAVFTKYKKQGIGKLLLSGIEEWAKETGAKGVRLVSGSSRVGAHEFYHHCGYSGDKQQLNLKKYVDGSASF